MPPDDPRERRTWWRIRTDLPGAWRLDLRRRQYPSNRHQPLLPVSPQHIAGVRSTT